MLPVRTDTGSAPDAYIMKKETFILLENDAGRRLDRVIRKFLADMPMSKLYEAIRKGLIRINGKRAPLNYRTAAGDTLTITDILLPSARPNTPVRREAQTLPSAAAYTSAVKPAEAADVPPAAPSEIQPLFTTADILIINKPAGLPVHGSRSVAERLTGLLSVSELRHSLSFRPGPLHRLDKDTTGVLCFSRTLAGAQWFSECLRKKTIDKYYLGIVRGMMPAQLIATTDGSASMQTQCFAAGFNTQLGASLMVFRLITGKKHQIRKHTLHVGHPLIGDTRYGGGSPLPRCTGYLLHAWQLFFPEVRPPDMPVRVEAPLFPEMEACLARFFPDWRPTAEQIVENAQGIPLKD